MVVEDVSCFFFCGIACMVVYIMATRSSLDTLCHGS